jgi:N-acetylglucosaminyldiphosphoundecaprenol N-acetyl-beta-D-mannosaminyltransferase
MISLYKIINDFLTRIYKYDLDLIFQKSNSADQNMIIVTTNLNHLRVLSQNQILRSKYLNSDFILPDGMPIIWLHRWLHKNSPRNIDRITGVDLADNILRSKKNIFVIGSSKKILTKIRSNYTDNSRVKIQITGDFSAYYQENLVKKAESLFLKLNRSEAKYVLVCLGFPKQEELAMILKDFKYTEPKIFCCVGGSLDILSGKFKRAPILVQNLGLEWLHRLLLDFMRLFPRYILDFVFLLKLMLIIFLLKIRSIIRLT